jgi:hypothetical protein
MQQEVQILHRRKVVQVQLAAAFSGTAGAEGEQAAESGPAGAAARQRGDLRPLREAEAGGGEEARDRGAVAGGLLERLEGADEARDRVAVGDREGGQAELDRAERVFLRVAAAGEEGEVRGDREFGEGHGATFRPAHPRRGGQVRG